MFILVLKGSGEKLIQKNEYFFQVVKNKKLLEN